MLICPECEFSNPDTNKFCQSCGTSLTQKDCDKCGSKVPLDALNCNNCGALTGKVLWAIVLESQSRSKQGTDLTTDPGDQETSGQPLLLDADDEYLDPQQRYQIIGPVKATDDRELELNVLDRNPLQISLLSALENKNEEVGQKGKEDTSLDRNAAIPKMAQVYLQLQSELPQEGVLPRIHDAWSNVTDFSETEKADSKAVVLLEDRSDWQLLLDWWSQEPLLLEQMLFILGQMINLWEMLEPVGCRQSLLLLENLLLDEDQFLCLKRLYSSAEDSPISLSDLGQLWQKLFEASEETTQGSLILLVQQLIGGEISTTAQLQARVRAIASEISEAPSAGDRPLSKTGGDFSEWESDLDTTAPDFAQTVTGAVSSPTRLQLDRQPTTTTQPMDDLPTVVLPMQLFSLEDAGMTDTGRQRDHNEDAFCIQTQIERFETKVGRTIHAQGLYILCDGMGGHAGGEVASALAVDTLKNYFSTHWFNSKDDNLPEENSIYEAVLQANKAIYDLNEKQDRTGSGRMGTTLVLVLVQDTNVAVAHVGDSRIYKFTRKQGLTPVTRDHDVGQREIQRGVEPDIAYSRPDAYQLTQALGPRNDDFVKPDIRFLEINEDTLLLLSSDGLTDNDLVENHAATHLEPLLSSRASLERGVSELIDLANEYNGHDNITTVIVRTKVRPNIGLLNS